jgi:hypothetical protein
MSRGTTRHYVLEASFDDPAGARRAVLALEGKGIDADEIRVLGPDSVPTPDTTREADLRVTGDLARWAIEGALVGAVAGAAVIMLAVWALGVAPFIPWGLVAAMAGAILGSTIGGFWAAGSRLPVNEEAFDTYAMDAGADAPVVVEVRLADSRLADEAAELLRHMDARRVERHDT